jgi:uncharacterized protein (TIGR00369 family)
MERELNPDQELLRRLRKSGGPLAVDTNPLGAAMGATLLSLDDADGRVRIGYTLGPQFLQGMGVVQGGIVMAMLDFAAAFASLAKLPEGESASTASMTVSLQSAVRPRGLVATGIVERAGRRLIFARAELHSEGEPQPLATASSVMSVRPDRPPAGA